MNIEALKNAPISYQNWINSVNSSFDVNSSEYLLYTDAPIIGDQVIIGPYKLINTVAIGTHPYRIVIGQPTLAHDIQCLPALALQMDYYFKKDKSYMINWKQKHDENYHGGFLEDEICALISVCLGIRLQSGGATRQFADVTKRNGRPIAYNLTKTPSFPIPTHHSSTIISNLIKKCHIEEDLKLLFSFPNLTPKNANALMKAARLYQNAVWISDNSPELCWLFLVSAIETVASQWKTSKTSLVDLLYEFEPDLVNYIEEHAKENQGEILIEKIAKKVAPVKKAQKKFISFILEFLPDEPTNRPPVAFQHDWASSAFEKSLKLIYRYRSEVLHQGKSIPAPMCDSPHFIEKNYAEVPIGEGMSVGDFVWRKEDIPMMLNTFEYIVRHSILNWWKSLVDDS